MKMLPDDLSAIWTAMATTLGRVSMMTPRRAKLDINRHRLLPIFGTIAAVAFVALALLQAPRLWAQSPATAPAPAPSFEVASIKPNQSGDGNVRLMFRPDGLTAQGATLKLLIGLAYDVKDFQVTGLPGWADSEQYTIDAKIGEATLEALNKLPPEQRQEQRRLMLQSLLAERFKLKVSHSTKEGPIYALVVAKNGPKFAQSATTPPGPSAAALQGRFKFGPGEIELKGMPIKGMADWLSRMVDRKVIDKTGLEGNYDLTLHWTPEGQAPLPGPGDGAAAPSPDSSGPSIFTALQEQLGLKLESQKGPVDTLIVDSVEKPSQN